MRKKRRSSLINSVRLDIRAAKQIRTPGWVLVCLFIASLVCGQALYHSGRSELAGPLLNSVIVLTFMIVFKRRLWRHAWFWIIMAIVAALHIPLILYIPWTTKWIPAAAFAGLDSLDFLLLLLIFDALERFTGNGEPPESASEAGD